MKYANHEYDITIGGVGFRTVMVRETLPQALVDDVRLALNPLAVDILVTWILKKKGPRHPLRKLTGLTPGNFVFVINQTNV